MLKNPLKIGVLAFLMSFWGLSSTLASQLPEDKVDRTSKVNSLQEKVDLIAFSCTLQTTIHVAYSNGSTADITFEATGDTCAQAGRTLDVDVAVFGIGGYICGCYKAYEL